MAKILVIDDERSIRNTLKESIPEQLENLGAEVNNQT